MQKEGNKAKPYQVRQTGANPNVYYELGLAYAARKHVILITQNVDDLPAWSFYLLMLDKQIHYCTIVKNTYSGGKHGCCN